MKKNFLLFVLGTFLTLFAAETFAADYDLIIAGVAITDANKNNITAAVNSSYNGTASGTITYDPTSNILTLNGASIRVITPYCIFNSISNLTIQLIGNNTITAKDWGIYSTLANFTIKGSGSLTINADTIAIEHSGCNLTIDKTTLTAKGGQCGIKGYDGWDEVLTINSSTVKATGTKKGSICDLKNLVLNDSKITQPAAAAFNATNKAICSNGNIVKTEVAIAPVIYDLWIAGVQVTGVNKDSITAAVVATGNTASGKITYTTESNTLTLDGASLDVSGSYCIENKIDSLTINLVGENTITSTNWAGIRGQRSSLTITGSGSLTVYGTYGIYLDNCNLDINNTNVTAKGYYSGIRGYNGNNEILTVTNSTVIATDLTEGSIVKLNNIILNGCEIARPTGATFDASKRAVCLNGAAVKGDTVVIGLTYDLWVAGVQVSDVNKDSITGTGISGKVSYDTATNTLTLDNVTITSEDGKGTYDEYGIYNRITNLKVNLMGNNAITASNVSIISGANMSIVGNGSLVAGANNAAIMAATCNITIEDVTLSAIGGRFGIFGGYGSVNNLTIKNANVKAVGTEASIVNFTQMILDFCKITSPAGAAFEDALYGVALNGVLVKEEVVIEPISGDGVREILAENVKIRMQNRQLTVENSDRKPIAVYNVMGQLIATRYNPGETETIILPAAGVYIVRVGMGATRVVTL